MNSKKAGQSISSLLTIIASETGTKKTTLYHDYADALSVSSTTFQRMITSEREISFEEAKKLVDYTLNTYSHDVDHIILRRYLESFWDACEYGDNTITWGDFSDVESSSKQLAEKLVFYMPASAKFGKAIEREEIENTLFQEIQPGCRIFVHGISGSGKSSVVNNVVTRTISGSNEYKFDSVVWVSSDGVSSELTQSRILEVILSAFDIGNSASFDDNEKLDKIFRILSSRRTILIVDNFETINDSSVIELLLKKFPATVSLIIISQYSLEHYPELAIFEEQFFEVKVDSLSIGEWKKLAKLRAAASTKVKRALRFHEDKILDFIYSYCGGNAFAMLHILGSISFRICNGESAKSIIANYAESSDSARQAALDKLKASWYSSLSDTDRRLLLTVLLFPDGISTNTLTFPDGKKLNSLADISGIDGVDEFGAVKSNSQLYESITKCTELNLLESVQDEDEDDMITTRFFVCSSIKVVLRGEFLGERSVLCNSIIESWIYYFRALSEQIQFCYNDVRRMKILDQPGMLTALREVLEFCYKNQRYNDYIFISENTKYYFYTRGISGFGEENVHIRRAKAAHEIGDKETEFSALLYFANIGAKILGISDTYRDVDLLEKSLKDLEALKNENDISVEMLQKQIYVYGLFYLGKKEYHLALEKLNEYISFVEKTGYELSGHDLNAALRWKAVCLIAIGGDVNCNEAIMLAERARENAIETNFGRAVVHSSLLKANALLGIENHDLNSVTAELDLVQEKLSTVNDKSYYADFYRLKAKVAAEKGFIGDARDSLIKAIEMYKEISGNAVLDLRMEFSDESYADLFL